LNLNSILSSQFAGPGSDIISAYDMMLSTVDEYVEDANYFTIEFKAKFNVYDVQSKTNEKLSGKTSWKQFFSETYAHE
jgi:hypothetical protein